jgi:hypothetical protein
MKRRPIRKRTEPAFIEPMQCKPVRAPAADAKCAGKLKQE